MDKTPEETKKRLAAALRGAFSGPPTPLKDIPKKGGESRAKKTGAAKLSKPKTRKT